MSAGEFEAEMRAAGMSDGAAGEGENVRADAIGSVPCAIIPCRDPYHHLSSVGWLPRVL